MNTNELNQKISNMEAELAEMKALLSEPIQASNYWQPSVSNFEKYFFVNQIGQIRHDYANSATTKRYRVFKTEAEAKEYAEYINAEETLRKAIAEANKGWLPNWSDENEIKYGFYLNLDEDTIEIELNQAHKCKPIFMYIKSEDDAKFIMNTYEKELKTYLSY